MTQDNFLLLSLTNYRRFVDLVPQLETLPTGWHRRLKADGFMDLSFEVLTRSDSSMDVAIAHYYTQNGDLVPDPDMRIRLDFKRKAAFPMSFQNSLVYREAMDEQGRGSKREVADQSAFLCTWLRNLKSQGHKLPSEQPERQD